MTSENREYIVREHHSGRTYKDIAGELGISPAAISLDRRRHGEIWESEQRWLEFKIRFQRGLTLDEQIKESRKILMKFQAGIEEYRTTKEAVFSENSDVRPEFLVKFLEIDAALTKRVAKQEAELCIMLAKALNERYELSLSEEIFPDVASK